MARPDSGTTRWLLAIGLWAVLILPALVSSQSQEQEQGQGTATATRQVVIRSSGELLTLLSREPARPRRMSDAVMTVPPDNPITDEKVALGRQLFFDKALSIDNSVSCATCHDPERAFADQKTIAVGVAGSIGRRNSPALINRGYGRLHFWDGRAASLEVQVLQPIEDPREMALSKDELLTRLASNKSYSDRFAMAFSRPLEISDVGRALAAYLRTIKSTDAPYDKFIDGDTSALTTDAQAGLQVFRARARCGICHREPLFTDEAFYNTGIAWKPSETDPSGAIQDPGRFAVTNNARDRGAFKVPTLREISRTAPYMHDGSLATLSDVVEFYDKGGRPNPNLMPLIRPLGLTPDEKRQLIAFLESLNGVVSGR